MAHTFNFDTLYPEDEPFAVVFDVETTGLIRGEGQPLDLVLEQFTQDIAECDYFVGFNVMFDKYVVEADCIRHRLVHQHELDGMRPIFLTK